MSQSAADDTAAISALSTADTAAVVGDQTSSSVPAEGAASLSLGEAVTVPYRPGLHGIIETHGGVTSFAAMEAKRAVTGRESAYRFEFSDFSVDALYETREQQREAAANRSWQVQVEYGRQSQTSKVVAPPHCTALRPVDPSGRPLLEEGGGGGDDGADDDDCDEIESGGDFWIQRDSQFVSYPIAGGLDNTVSRYLIRHRWAPVFNILPIVAVVPHDDQITGSDPFGEDGTESALLNAGTPQSQSPATPTEGRVADSPSSATVSTFISVSPHHQHVPKGQRYGRPANRVNIRLISITNRNYSAIGREESVRGSTTATDYFIESIDLSQASNAAFGGQDYELYLFAPAPKGAAAHPLPPVGILRFRVTAQLLESTGAAVLSPGGSSSLRRSLSAKAADLPSFPYLFVMDHFHVFCNRASAYNVGIRLVKSLYETTVTLLSDKMNIHKGRSSAVQAADELARAEAARSGLADPAFSLEAEERQLLMLHEAAPFRPCVASEHGGGTEALHFSDACEAFAFVSARSAGGCYTLADVLRAAEVPSPGTLLARRVVKYRAECDVSDKEPSQAMPRPTRQAQIEVHLFASQQAADGAEPPVAAASSGGKDPETNGSHKKGDNATLQDLRIRGGKHSTHAGTLTLDLLPFLTLNTVPSSGMGVSLPFPSGEVLEFRLRRLLLPCYLDAMADPAGAAGAGDGGRLVGVRVRQRPSCRGSLANQQQQHSDFQHRRSRSYQETHAHVAEPVANAACADLTLPV